MKKRFFYGVALALTCAMLATAPSTGRLLTPVYAAEVSTGTVAFAAPTVKVNVDTALISWKASVAAENYEVYRNGSLIATLPKGTLNYTDNLKGAPYGQVKYKVVATAGGDTASTEEVSVMHLAKPVLTVKGTDKVSLSWTAVEGAGHYNVLRYDGSEWVTIKKTSKTAFTDTTAVSGTRYCYRVSAGTTTSVGPVSATAKGAKLAAPVMLKAYSKATGVKVTWEKAKGAVSYDLYRRKAGKTKWYKVLNTKKLYATDATGSTNASYEYAVAAVYNNCSSNHTTYSKFGAKTSDAALAKAESMINSLCTYSMSNEKKLETCYNWFKKVAYRHFDDLDFRNESNTKWLSSYALDAYGKRGNCYRFAAGVAYFAHALGYQTQVVKGWLGGSVAHGWTEVKFGTKTYVCDAQLQFTHARTRGCNHQLFKTTYSKYNCDGMRLTPVKRLNLPL